MLMDPETLLLQNLDAIDRVVAIVCRRHGVEGADAEDFRSTVRLRLVDDGYKILRSFQGRSKFLTYITIVVQRMLIDYRIHEWGKWHTSAEAQRLGPLAVRIESLVYRDGKTVEEVLPLVQADDPALTLDSVRAILDRLPQREPRRRAVSADILEHVASPAASTDSAALHGEHASIAARLASVLRCLIERLPEEDRLLLQLRFDAGMTVAQIARSLHLDQKRLYRRLENLFNRLRTELEAAGFEREDVRDFIGSRAIVFDFQLRKPQGRPSMETEGVFAGGQEERFRDE
jgi:RNA polymerase sigma factor (sigma-70 family)